MNQIATKNEGGLSYKNVNIAQTGGGGMLLPQTFGDVVAFATMMSRSQHAIPRHLRENDGACMAVTMQALRWEMDPFMVASKSYNVKDLIAYEAQLVAAVVNTRAPIAKRPVYLYEGAGDTRKCIVSCEMLDGSTKEYESPELGKITTKNSPLWKADPDQQLGYFSIRSWARRHTPEVILGVYTPEEAEQFSGPDRAKDITSRVIEDPLSDEPVNRPQLAQGEHFDLDDGDGGEDPHDALTGEILDNTNTGEDLPASTVDDAGSAPASEGGGIAAQSSSPSSSMDAELRKHLMDFARKASATLEDPNLSDEIKGKSIDDMHLNYREVIAESDWSKLSTIKICLQAVFAGKRTLEQSRQFIAKDLLDCQVDEIGG